MRFSIGSRSLCQTPSVTALGDFVADTTGLGFERGALVFAGMIALVTAAHVLTKIPKSLLFWAAYVLSRPLGATLGDILTKSHPEGGLGFSRITSSLVLALAWSSSLLVLHFVSGAKPCRR